MKKAVLKNCAIFTDKDLWRNLQACYFIKERLQHMFPFEYRKIFKNTYFEEHLRTAASGNTEMNQRFPKMML